mmetsp:Transcript_40196/g.72428  ORF Transcript_40196/g.72428 Transcript_40196/m.72428 type:complete len:108 (-) Transcript_40196:1095-1418(-)
MPLPPMANEAAASFDDLYRYFQQKMKPLPLSTTYAPASDASFDNPCCLLRQPMLLLPPATYDTASSSNNLCRCALRQPMSMPPTMMLLPPLTMKPLPPTINAASPNE